MANEFIARKGIISLDGAQVTGSLSVTGNISASIFTGSFVGDGSQLTGITGAATASYVEYTNVANKPALVSGSSQISFNGIVDKPTLVSGSSQITYSGISGIPAGIVSGSSQVSFNGIVDKPTLVSGSSQVTYGELSGIPVGIVSSSAQITGYNIFATTGSNQFNGSQAITGSLTVTGQVVAQTLNVQQVTSSIVYSSGSNIFGNSLANTQQFTGSVSVTGSLAVNGALSGTSATFTGTALLGGATATNPLSIRTANGESYIRFLNADGSTYGDFERSITGAGAVRFTGANFRFTAGAEVVGALTGSIATFSSTVAINGSTSVDSLTVSRNTDNNSGGITLYNANTSGYGSALTFRVNYAGVYNTSRIHGDWDTGNAGALHFFTANTSQTLVERMLINGSGNVIIGNTTAYGGLTVSDFTTNDGNDSLAFFYRGTSGGHESLIKFYDFRGQVNAAMGNNLEDDGSGTQKARLVFKTSNSSAPIERMRITSDGYVRLTSSSGGIQFNGDTAAANALDDYEEGTWTATLTCGTSGTITLDNSGCIYTKIGRLVNVSGFITVSSVSSPTGRLLLGGFPFTQISDGVPAGLVYFTTTNAFTGIPVLVGTQDTGAFIDRNDATGANPALDLSNAIKANTELYFNITYTS
jgi:hypothetical protein